MISLPNSKGCVGISHEAKAVVHSAVINNVFNLAQALTNAASHLSKGDVILIELQATGPSNKYVAMQYWSDVFSAIVAATAKGITVVEAAGNGNENFDLPIFNNTGLQKDSGAIVVGAGIPPANAFDFDGGGGFGAAYQQIGVPRPRIWFSNYGRIVKCKAGASTSPRSPTATCRATLRKTNGIRCASLEHRAHRRLSPARWPACRDGPRPRTARQ